MLDLVLSILFFNVILILFKLFEKYRVDNFQAIIINYIVAGSCGYFMLENRPSVSEIAEFDFLPFAIVIGLFFIVVFNLLAEGAQKVGLAISTIANKMSVILPVIASILLYGDSLTALKIIGIILALGGVFLSSIEKGKLSFDKQYLWIILVIFLGQGVADILFNYAQQHHVSNDQSPLFFAVLFYSAFVSGCLLLTMQIIRGKAKLNKNKLLKNIRWGIAVGIPNYLTLFFFFRALESGFFESSQAYPILNMGVIVISALTGWLVFKEKLSLINWLGILISVVAIAAISAG
ncbi:MAG: EamA family transporter [Crocinitomicaceae bacterium]